MPNESRHFPAFDWIYIYRDRRGDTSSSAQGVEEMVQRTFRICSEGFFSLAKQIKTFETTGGAKGGRSKEPGCLQRNQDLHVSTSPLGKSRGILFAISVGSR